MDCIPNRSGGISIVLSVFGPHRRPSRTYTVPTIYMCVSIDWKVISYRRLFPTKEFLRVVERNFGASHPVYNGIKLRVSND